MERLYSAVGEHHEAHANDIAARAGRWRNPYEIEEIVECDGGIVRSGPVEISLNEVVPDTVRAVRIGTDSPLADAAHLPQALVEFGHSTSGYFRSRFGVRVTVAGAERAWVANTFEVLVEECIRCVPKWAWLRRWFGSVVLAAFPVALYVAGLVAWNRRHTGDSEQPLWPLLVGLGVWAAIGGWLWLVRRFVLRPFQVIEEGGESSAKLIVTITIGALGLLGSVMSIVAPLF